jgi:F-type H+-transporting ATPase subunit delta
MGPSIIARNYAETLLTLAQKHGGVEAVDVYGRAIDDVAELLRREPRVREFLETPRVDLEGKKRAVRASFGGGVPEYFLRFLLIVVEKRRQGLLRQIAEEYRGLVDEARNRVRAQVTLAQAPTPELEREIVASLERRLGKTVIATFQVEPELIGGVVIRVGERILDGSVRRKLGSLRRRMLEAPLPAVARQG